SAPEEGAGLLPHVLAQVLGATATGTRRARALPAAERLDVRPRARGGSCGTVDIGRPRLDPGEPLLDLLLVPGEETGGETEDRVVGALQARSEEHTSELQSRGNLV